MVKIHRPPTPSSGKSTMPMDYEGNDETMTAQSPEEAGQHVTNALRGHMGMNDNDADDKPMPKGKHAMKMAMRAKKGASGY